ncbi:transposase [Baaleninema simplex]|uniref:transposase n=1 Tax=Baaleninema simplex TaxID=2862350 RepID=UPI004054B15E
MSLKRILEKFMKQLKTQRDGKNKFKEWLCKAQSIYGDAVKTIRNHLNTICNYFLSRTTNGVMEGINNRLKLIKRQAYGFINFENMRIRFLYCFT